MKCANFNCENELTQFELSRITVHNSRYRLCKRCRFQITKNGIEKIRCGECGNVIDRQIKTILPFYCLNCANDAKRKTNRASYTKRRLKNSIAHTELKLEDLKLRLEKLECYA